MGDVLIILAGILLIAGCIALQAAAIMLAGDGTESARDQWREWRRDREHRALEEKALAKNPRTSLLRPAKRVGAESETLLRSTESGARESILLRPKMELH